MRGTMSIYHLWKDFNVNLNSNGGGAGGESVALMEKYGENLPNPLITAQNFGYKKSNMLNEPLCVFNSYWK